MSRGNPSLSSLLPYFGLCAHVKDQRSERRKRTTGGCGGR